MFRRIGSSVMNWFRAVWAWLCGRDEDRYPSIVDEDFSRLFAFPKPKERWEYSSPNTLSQKGKRKRARQYNSTKGRNKK